MKFKYDDVIDMSGGPWDYPHFFECSMISYCSPHFDDCNTNHEVADILTNAGVISSNDEEDAETCSLVVNFKSRQDGENFIDRLNNYLQDKSNQLK